MWDVWMTFLYEFQPSCHVFSNFLHLVRAYWKIWPSELYFFHIGYFPYWVSVAKSSWYWTVQEDTLYIPLEWIYFSITTEVDCSFHAIITVGQKNKVGHIVVVVWYISSNLSVLHFRIQPQYGQGTVKAPSP